MQHFCRHDLLPPTQSWSYEEPFAYCSFNSKIKFPNYLCFFIWSERNSEPTWIHSPCYPRHIYCSCVPHLSSGSWSILFSYSWFPASSGVFVISIRAWWARDLDKLSPGPSCVCILLVTRLMGFWSIVPCFGGIYRIGALMGLKTACVQRCSL